MTFPELLLLVYTVSCALRLISFRSEVMLSCLTASIVMFVWLYAPYISVLLLLVNLLGELALWVSHIRAAWRRR